jgi:hypothetical protein
MNRNTKNRINTDQELIAGIKKHFGKAPLVFDGEKHSAAEIIKVLQGRIDTGIALIAGHAALRTSVNADRAKAAETSQYVARVRQAILLTFGGVADVLADFGLVPPRERRALTAAERLSAVEKVKATRAARHTMGKRQRETIKGESSSDEAPAIASPPAVKANGSGSPTASPAGGS